jgi:hypothetical protein
VLSRGARRAGLAGNTRRRAGLSGLFGLSRLSGLFRSLDQRNRIDRINQIDQLNERDERDQRDELGKEWNRHRSEAEPVPATRRSRCGGGRTGRVSGLEFRAGDAALPDDRKECADGDLRVIRNRDCDRPTLHHHNDCRVA